MMVVTTLSVVLACIAVACARSPPKPSPCICTKQYDPVCGDDGKTYGNQCTLNCAASKEGVKKLKSGECPVCPIPAIFAEVCGANMKTYANKYIPQCLGIPVALNRKCPACAIPYIYRPVCGSNGYTYDNEYIAKCIEVTVAHEGPCQES